MYDEVIRVHKELEEYFESYLRGKNMSKLGKTTTSATYGILNIVMKPIYEQMKKERKEEVRRWNKSLDIASQDAMAEARRFEVHQPFDAIIHQHWLW